MGTTNARGPAGADIRRKAAEYLEHELDRRNYEAASRRDRTSGWITTGSSANAAASRALPLLRDRARDLARNDPYLARGLAVIRTNVIGTGIRAQLEGESELEQLWKRWAASTDCDADGLHDLYGLQSLIMRAVAESGEVLVRLRPRRVADGLAVPIQLQVIEADHIDTMKDGPAEKEGHYWVQGVELDALGRRTGYWIFRNHPGDHRRSMSLESVFVPAQSMLHIYRVDRPGQVRGIPWAAPVVIRSRELKDYEDAQLLRQKIAACFALFRQDMAFDLDADVASPAASNEKEELGRDYVEPGMMIDLPAGKEIKFATPPSVSGYEEFVTRQLRAIAVGLGVSYEALTGDFSSVNFSSGRMGHIEFQRNVAAWQSAIMVTQFCRPVWRWFSTVATLMGVPDEGLQPSWILPRREMIDPTREVPAAIQKIRGGLTTLSDEIRSQGMDPSEVFARLAAERELLNSLGLTTESDPAQAQEWRMPGAEGAASRE